MHAIATRLIAIGASFAAAFLLAFVATAANPAWSEEETTTAKCLSCHDFGPESPVHAVMSGSHGVEDITGIKGCQDCHGPSSDHARAPTRVSPAVSFGPRWSATTAAQDSQCLACHEDNVTKHWKDALHMVNNLTCITCHDIHVEEDRVLFENQQAEVCTVCHKAQKRGIHGMQEDASRNPACTTCHNPHDHEDAQAQMLTNNSEGCSHCHDLVQMNTGNRSSDKARSYHKVMARPGATCLQCHQGISHAPADSVPPMQPIPRASRNITLFYPGMADSDWLLQAHPGSQPLRQGAPCQRCHRGEEAAIGEKQASDRVTLPARDVQVAFKRHGNELEITLDWQAGSDDQAIALMWGGPGSEPFRRGGCFAACHSDMPGMSGDREAGIGKYLMASRSQQRQIGQPSIILGADELAALQDQGEFAELWRISLNSDSVERALVLADTDLQATDLISVNRTNEGGRWRVTIRTSMDNTGDGLSFSADQKYTFGIALNGAGNSGGGHWVSLPLTLSFGGDDTDFTAE